MPAVRITGLFVWLSSIKSNSASLTAGMLIFQEEVNIGAYVAISVTV